MNPPSGAEGRRSCDERASIAGEIHDEDTPLDGKLLDDDDASPLVMLGDLGEVDGDLGRGYTDADTVDDPSGDQLSIILAGDLHSGPDEPPQTAKED